MGAEDAIAGARRESAGAAIIAAALLPETLSKGGRPSETDGKPPVSARGLSKHTGVGQEMIRLAHRVLHRERPALVVAGVRDRRAGRALSSMGYWSTAQGAA